MTIQYGSAPKDLGCFCPNVGEMMCYVYLPIKFPAGHMSGALRLPERLKIFQPMAMEIMRDVGRKFWADNYVYLTAKTLWVEPGSPGNRPGWHADGYGSNGDLNYIWADMNPTEFAVQKFENIPDDDWQSMVEMERQVCRDSIRIYPDRHLLKLDESVVHRVNPEPKSGVRTFVKFSISRHKYNLEGNSHNYLIDYEWEMHSRSVRRNIDNKDFAA